MRKLSILFSETRDPQRAVERVVAAEQRGFHSAVLGTAFGLDPLTVFAVAATRTRRILLTTAVVPSWPRHPLALAQQAATVHAVSGGRLRLGVGPSHAPVIEHMYGLRFEKPVRHAVEYLTVLRGLLQEGASKFAGETYQVNAPLDVVGGRGVPVLLSALGEPMARAAGRCADGVLPWLAPPRFVGEVLVPAVRAGAAAADRPAPPLIAEIPCVLSTDRDEVREAVRRELAIYPRMPFYRTLLERAGVPGAAESARAGWSDGMIDAVVPHGDEAALARAIDAYFGAGADEVVLSPLGAGRDPAASFERCCDTLARIARDAVA